MPPPMRPCAGPADYAAISDFLFTLYQPGNRDGNWLQPIWEYAYTHPWFEADSAGRIGLWEDRGALVAVANYELRLGEAFFQVAPGYEALKPELLAHAEAALSATDADGARRLHVFVPDFDPVLEALVRARGYERAPGADRPMAQFASPVRFPDIRLPAGFRLMSLAEDNDPAQAGRVLHRGFNHPGEPPPDAAEGCRKMQSGPHFRPELTIVVEAPTGEWVSYAGLWYEARNGFGYVEPVATDPAYRRRGLGTAAVLEGLRRCAELGASVAYVGTHKPFYLAMGFRKLFTVNCWVKRFAA